MTYRIIRDNWLDSICPFSVFLIEFRDEHLPDTSTLRDLGSTILEYEGFIHMKCSVANEKMSFFMQSAGFYLVDINVTFEWNPRLRNPSKNVSHSNIRKAKHTEKEAILKIASTCFRHSRFHQDPLIPNKLAHRINEQWVADYFERDMNGWVDVALMGDEVAGFHAIRRVHKNNKQFYVVDLIGVHPRHQKQGIGEAMIEHLLEKARKENMNVRVGTQIRNIPAVRLYEKLGFRLVDARNVFHIHVRHGKILHPLIDSPWEYEANPSI